ncbi:DUF433 domain-containing protein [Tunicatimonas pelagia]|uniref:DUF433 domain-containing protein n=1 Tax=Tunicatimonas pelagia TaxID=931531 RepID=UPI0026654F18|nr:DUF433 domain-containing protein [Tunicatimonas pelagia]WKN41729.1 DUF433 domain-containing protein [Tunicatimonas pelagia]
MSRLLERITIDDEICNGKPIIRGMRITVQTIVGFLLAGTSEKELLHQYPILEKEDIEACRQFTNRMMERSFTIRDLAA